MKRLLVAAALLLAVSPVTLPATTAQAATALTQLYVAPNGSDGGPGTAALPFKTLQRARDAVRAVTADTDVVVYVKPGDYYLDAPIEFTAQDSGRAGHRVTYRVWGGPPGSARFIGGQRVTGWTQYKGNIWQAKVGRRFDTLYEDGVRAIKARTPNLEPGDLVTAHAHYWVAAPGTESYTVLPYKAGDFDPTGWDLRDAELRIWPRDNWFEEHQPIASVDPAAHTITLKNQTRYSMGLTTSPSRFYVQGMLSALDQPGEFHYDSTAGVLYYWPRHGLGDVVVPRTKTILSLNGVHDVTFDGLGFEDTDFTDFYRHGYPVENGSGENHQYGVYDRQIEMAPNRTGMIFMTDTANVTITRSHLRNSGYSAIYALFANHDDRIESNLIEHAGYAGVFFEGHYPGEGDVLTHNVLAGNLIHDVGELVGHGAGYILMQSSNNEISNSEIYNSPRFGVYLAGYRGIPNQDLYTRDNTVRNLNVHDVMQDSRDGAAVYTFGTSTSSTGPFQVNNFDQIAINYAYSHPEANNSQPATSLDPAAVYLDEGTYGTQVSNVKAENIQRSPVFKTNKSAGVVTNSSWQSGFDESKIDYPNIGLRADYPYGALTIDAGSSTDQQFLHGTRATATGTTAPDATYRHGTFSYRLPVPNGTYAVDLSFLDPLSTAAGQRVFSVTAEGQTVISGLDVYKVAGHNPVNRRVTVTVTDGQLDLAFTPTTGEALVSAIAVSGGVTPPPGRYEAEYATISQGIFENTHTGFSGTGYVNGDNVAGSYLEWNVNAASAGTATVKVRYSNGTTTNRPSAISVNGTTVFASRDYNSTTTWDTWATDTFTVPVNAGANTIRATATTANGNPNIDYIDVDVTPSGGTPVDYQAEDATISQGGVFTNHLNYTGTGFVDYTNIAGSYVEFTVNAASAGSTPLVIRYANGTTVDRPMDISVNGTVVASNVSFPPTANWDTWVTSTKSVPLNAGSNTIRLTATTANGGPNLDKITVG